MKSVSVIGAGFSGLASACALAKEEFQVTVFEKNESPGGRARKFAAEGFTFDMGPSWYWMPDVFERFFNEFNKEAKDYYKLIRLDPSYRIYYGKNDFMDVPANEEKLFELFESIEKGSGDKLKVFLKEGKYKYEVGINDLVYKPGLSVKELLDPKLFSGVFRLHLLQSISSYIRKFFKNRRLIQLLEFPVLFLGSTPEKTPALYSLMNYADMSLGTWYPKGGMHKIIEGMESLAKSLGVQFKYSSPITKIEFNSTKINALWSSERRNACDYVIGSADYHHIEQQLLPEKFRKYDEHYWDKKTMAPSSLLFYLGINKKINGLLHHTLFFDEDFALHAHQIYENPQWPTAPQFYVSCPSKTDDTVAPEGCENILILIPVAAGLSDDDKTREKYFDMVMKRLEHILDEPIREHIVFKRSYAHNDFASDYNAYRGNAYGLANTLRQTANLRPTITNKKLSNLFYTGQLTVPGPGVPPAIISGQVVARELISRDKKNSH